MFHRAALILLLAGPVVAATDGSTGGNSKNAPAGDPRLVSTLTYSQFFHRHDHLVIHGTNQITPEDAIAQGMTACPECRPPYTSQELAKEAEGERSLTVYYKAFLQNRVKALSDVAPPGADPAAPLAAGPGRAAAAAAAGALPAAPAAPALPEATLPRR